MRRGSAAAMLAALALAGCGEQEFAPPDRTRQVAQADSLYSDPSFDTIAWESDDARVLAGNVVYSAHCRTCHGSLGEGGTAYGSERGLAVPSLVRPGWEEGDDVVGVRRRIFVGHPAGMPTWGVAGITPREIDAAAYYVVRQLRPEVLGAESERAPVPAGGM